MCLIHVAEMLLQEDKATGAYVNVNVAFLGIPSRVVGESANTTETVILVSLVKIISAWILAKEDFVASTQSAVFKTITQSASAYPAILETHSLVAVSCCLVA